jgi:hypothetical protein
MRVEKDDPALLKDPLFYRRDREDRREVSGLVSDLCVLRGKTTGF